MDHFAGDEPQRLNKIIAQAGVCSRRQADLLIEAGKVQVNGQTVSDLGYKVSLEKDRVYVNGKPLPKSWRTITYLVNKPKGVVCSRVKQDKKPIITELVPDVPPVYPVGRLDKDSEGLILLTNEGDLALKMTHPRYEHRKEYRVGGTFREPGLTAQMVVDRLNKSVKLGDGRAKADSVIIEKEDEKGATLLISVHEGRHHLVRRLCATAGLEVKSLERTRLGPLTLRGVPRGKFRVLTHQEVSRLR
jgi:23S rRNA pseudouridine2605 synthase